VRIWDVGQCEIDSVDGFRQSVQVNISKDAFWYLVLRIPKVNSINAHANETRFFPVFFVLVLLAA
jgi:hypothetical protein